MKSRRWKKARNEDNNPLDNGRLARNGSKKSWCMQLDGKEEAAAAVEVWVLLMKALKVHNFCIDDMIWFSMSAFKRIQDKQKHNAKKNHNNNNDDVNPSRTVGDRIWISRQWNESEWTFNKFKVFFHFCVRFFIQFKRKQNKK